MNYYVTRDGQQYGPYSLADLRQYLAQGNILLTDLARSDDMSQWATVRQILGIASGQMPQPQTPPAPQPQPQQPYSSPYAQPYSQPYSQPSTPFAQPGGYGYVGVQPGIQPTAGVMMPPGLHWGLVLLFAVLTCGIFSMVWMFVQASFVGRFRSRHNPTLFYGLGLACSFLGNVISAGGVAAGADEGVRVLGFLVAIGGAVLIIVGHFTMRSALEEYYNTVEPVGLRLSGVMTFFFNTFYFQYHMTRIRNWKLTGVWL